MIKRLLLVAVCCAVVFALTFHPARAIEKEELGIGSPAPPLDIEHWVQDGNGFFDPVNEFEDGKVYVVEFWATWCGPCVASMPHLAELQTKYRGRDVQIVSISDETLDEVKDLLQQEKEEGGKTFAEITSAYCLTTDPDRSVHVDYMEASNQQGIPTSFIVGKTGKIEWIGHPMSLDEPLEAVVEDTWDREAFKAEMEAEKNFEKAMKKISMLAGAQKFDDAIKVAESELKSVKVEAIKQRWVSIRNSLKLSAGQLDDDVIAYFRKQLDDMKGSPVSVARFSASLAGVIDGGGDAGPLADEALAACESELADVGDDENLQAYLHNTRARLYDSTGKLTDAIKAQEKAVAATSGRQQQRMERYLEILEEKASGEDEK